MRYERNILLHAIMRPPLRKHANELDNLNMVNMLQELRKRNGPSSYRSIYRQATVQTSILQILVIVIESDRRERYRSQEPNTEIRT